MEERLPVLGGYEHTPQKVGLFVGVNFFFFFYIEKCYCSVSNVV